MNGHIGRRARRLAARGALVAVLLGVLLPAPAMLAAAPACADEAHAALVVDTGGQELAYCVAIPGTVDGIELIRLAARQHGLQYSLGFGGDAVCSLAGVGVSGGDCFADFPRFWGYWIGAASGGWRWSSLGAGAVSVSPGDVQGWSWGAGQDGSSHPAPPITPLDAVCGPDDDPGGSGGGDARGNGGDGGNGGGSAANTADTAETDGDAAGGADREQEGDRDPGGGNDRDAERDEDNGATRDPVTPAPADGARVTTDVTPVSAMAPGSDGSGAAGVVVSLAALVLLIAGGTFLTWKRRAG